MTPYDKEYTVTTSGTNEVVALNFPGRAEITRIGVVLLGGAAFTADFFNRNFTGSPSGVVRAANNGSGKVRYTLDAYLPVKVGDVVAVAGTSVGGYNVATQRVAAVSRLVYDDGNYRDSVLRENRVIDTDAAYTADATGGTMTLGVPSAEQPLYKAYTQVAGTGSGEQVVSQQFVNQDPAPAVNTGVVRKLYVKLSATGTYKIAVRSRLGVGVG